MIGEIVKILRKKLKLSQADLSDKSGIPQGFISEIENGKKTPGLDTIKSLSRSLGVPVGELVGEAQKLPPPGLKTPKTYESFEKYTDSETKKLLDLWQLADQQAKDYALMILEKSANELQGKGAGGSDCTGQKSA